MELTHARAVAVMVVVTLLWSTAGVATRQLEAARSFFTLALLLVILPIFQGSAVFSKIRCGGRALWLSGVGWSVWFIAFMVALTLTTVANVLVTMALGPFIKALMARVVIGHTIPAQTWLAIALAGVGIAWMYGGQLDLGFGILLAWVGAGEVPGSSVLTGGSLVIGALVLNEFIGWRQKA